MACLLMFGGKHIKMPYGIPKTDAERELTHKSIYGTSAPAQRQGLGNPGALPKESAEVAIEALREREIRNYEALAALETIRVNQFVPFNVTKVMTSGINAVSQKLIFDVFEPGYVYVITSICGIDVDDAAHQIRIGVTDGATDLVYESGTVANAGDSVEYVGQLMLKETDKVYVEFWAVGANDTIRANMNGYKIRR